MNFVTTVTHEKWGWQSLCFLKQTCESKGKAPKPFHLKLSSTINFVEFCKKVQILSDQILNANISPGPNYFSVCSCETFNPSFTKYVMSHQPHTHNWIEWHFINPKIETECCSLRKQINENVIPSSFLWWRGFVKHTRPRLSCTETEEAC